MMQEIEIWKDIPGYEPYQASQLGRIRNGNGCLLPTHLTGYKPKQYLAVSLKSKDRRRSYKIHRLVLMAFFGSPQTRQVGCHKNDDPLNNHVDNLYWGTQKQNVADSVRSGKHYKFPEKNIFIFKPSISAEVINNIRIDYAEGKFSQKFIAEKYNVDPSYVSYLVRNKRRVAL